MLKKLITKYMPSPESLQNHKHLRMFRRFLHRPNLWQLNRHTAPGAFAIGLLVAWIPMPFQMVLSAALAIFFNVNLPVAVALVWITNPLTMPVMFYGAYLLGAWVLGLPEQHFQFEASWQWIESSFTTIAPPFLLGCLIFGVIFSGLGYFIIRSLWRYSILVQWNKRKK